MHSDHRTAYINPCCCLHADTLREHRLFHSLITDCCKCTSCMVWLRDRINLFKSISFEHFFLDHKRTVQMFTTLSGRLLPPHLRSWMYQSGHPALRWKSNRPQISHLFLFVMPRRSQSLQGDSPAQLPVNPSWDIYLPFFTFLTYIQLTTAMILFPRRLITAKPSSAPYRAGFSKILSLYALHPGSHKNRDSSMEDSLHKARVHR